MIYPRPILAWYTTKPNPDEGRRPVFHICICCRHNESIKIENLEINTLAMMLTLWRLYLLEKEHEMVFADDPERSLCTRCSNRVNDDSSRCGTTNDPDVVIRTIRDRRPSPCTH